MTEQLFTAQDLERGKEHAEPMKAMARAMLPALLDACGGYSAPIRAEAVTIPANLAHGLLAHLGASLAGGHDAEADDFLRNSLQLAWTSHCMALEDAAELCDGDASLYAAHANRDRQAAERLDGENRRAELMLKATMADRDAITCADMGRRIRSLKSKPGSKPTPAKENT